MKVLKKYDNAFSANLAKGLLEESGIHAYVLNENLAFSTGAVNTDLLSVELVVEDGDYVTAKALLDATSKPL